MNEFFVSFLLYCKEIYVDDFCSLTSLCIEAFVCMKIEVALIPL